MGSRSIPASLVKRPGIRHPTFVGAWSRLEPESLNGYHGNPDSRDQARASNQAPGVETVISISSGSSSSLAQT